MHLIRPFKALRPTAEYSAAVVAPPYDVVNTEEARKLAAGKPWSFLHISKPEIDLPRGTDPYASVVYQTGARNLSHMIAEGILMREPQPCYYLYRLIMGTHIQTGVVAVASVSAYDAGRIPRHEFTRPDKEDDRVRQIDTLNTQTGPVFLTYRHEPQVDRIVDSAIQADPVYDITADDGVRHTIWSLCDDEQIDALTVCFDSMDRLYIADGHHRSAAASRVAAMRRKTDSAPNDDAGYNYFLSVIFPDNQMQILEYNRVVRDLAGMATNVFLERIEERFSVEPADEAVRPAAAGEFGMYLPGQWYQLRIISSCVPEHDPVGRLDVSLLADNLIEPLLGIHDPRRDTRIDFVGGIRGLDELEKRVDSGEMAVAFSLHPASLADLMAVADAEEVMPPKSTWFEPKLADGLLSHVLD